MGDEILEATITLEMGILKPPPPTEEDALWVKRCQAGDPDAFEPLVMKFAGRIERLIWGILGERRLEAEDAVQESLQVAWQQLAQYRVGTSMRAWLLAIVTRRAWTLARSEMRRRGREDASSTPEQPADPEQHVRAAQTAAVIAAALEKMPEKRREAVIMRLDGGLSHADIAATLGSTEGSVRVLVHLGLKQLKAALAADAEKEAAL